MLETQYYQIKTEILQLASAFLSGDEAARERLSQRADFFPISRNRETPGHLQAIMIRRKGELFLVEDTPGGEQEVFALLQPMI